MPSAFLLGRKSLAAVIIASAVLVMLALITHRVVGWHMVADRASTIPANGWLAFAALMIASYLARVFRFWCLVRPLSEHVSIGAAAPVFLVHNALVTFVPARLGEVAMPALAHRWAGVHWSGVVGLLAWWRLVDLSVVCMLVLALVGTGQRAFAPLLWLAVAACALPLVVFGFRARAMTALARWGDQSTPRTLPKIVRRVIHGLPGSWRAALLDVLLACLAWACKLAAVAILLGTALEPRLLSGFDRGSVSWTAILSATIAADVAGSLPVPSFAGTGPYEAAAVAVLVAYGVTSGQALAAGLVAHGALLAGVLLSGIVGLGLQASRTVRARAHVTQH